MSVTLYASIRPRQAAEETPREVRGGGEDYAAAKAAVDVQIPEGWQNLGYSRWPGRP